MRPTTILFIQCSLTRQSQKVGHHALKHDPIDCQLNDHCTSIIDYQAETRKGTVNALYVDSYTRVKNVDQIHLNATQTTHGYLGPTACMLIHYE